LQSPPADKNVPNIKVNYSLDFVASDNGLKPDVEEFARVYNNESIILYTEDLILAGNYTLALVGTYSLKNSLKTYSMRV